MQEEQPDLNVNEHLESLDSLPVQARGGNVVGFVKEQINNILRPGGISYYNTGKGRGYQAVVDMNGANGAFTEVQSAVNYVEQLGGGKVLVSVGTYVIDSAITISTDGLELIGEDRETSVIRLAPATGGVPFMVSVEASNVIISNVTFDGNKSNQSAGTHHVIGYDSPSENLLVDSVNVVNQFGTGGVGLGVGGGRVLAYNCLFGTMDGFAVLSNSMDHSRFIACRAENVGYGFTLGVNNSAVACYVGTTTLGHGYSSDYVDSTFVSCVAEVCTGYGFEVNESDVSVVNCISRRNLGGGVRVQSGLYGVVTGCVIGDNLGTQVSFEVSNGALTSNSIHYRNIATGKNLVVLDGVRHNVISGNALDISPSGTWADATYSGILLTGTSTRNVVSNNTIDAALGTLNLAYGIRENSSADDFNVFVGNVITGAGTALGTQGASGTAGFNQTG